MKGKSKANYAKNFYFQYCFRKLDSKWMIEMDRFVVSLKGTEDEIIERQSKDSAATMKEQESFMKRFIILNN